MVMENLTLQGSIEYLNEIDDFLARAPVDLLSEHIVSARVVGEMSRVKHNLVAKNVTAFKALHPQDGQKNWRFFLAILKAHEQQELQLVVAKADIAKATTTPAAAATVDNAGRGRGPAKRPAR